jgi:hypothetical protein
LSIDEYDINLVNGLIGYVNSPIDESTINNSNFSFKLDFRPEMCKYDFFENIFACTIPFIKHRFTTEDVEIMEYRNYKSFGRRKICNKFEYGYCITDYLSQGSQWNKVIVYNESYGAREKYNSSLYTTITRAVKQVIIAI